MAAIETHKLIHAPQERTWAVIADPRLFAHWNTLHERWEGQVPTELALGARVTEVVNIMHIPNTVTFTADEFDPPRRVGLSGTGTGGMRVSLTMSVDPVDAVTSRAALQVHVSGALLFGPMGKRIEKTLGSELEASLDKLAQLLTASPAE
ncbi:type II toxin-antitoxin system Rv0910 family toxin [Mycobacterium sp. BMJ-28]